MYRWVLLWSEKACEPGQLSAALLANLRPLPCAGLPLCSCWEEGGGGVLSAGLGKPKHKDWLRLKGKQ